MTKLQLKQYLRNNPNTNSKELLDYLNTPERIEINNWVEYQLNGKLHRIDGPAIEYPNGDKEWYLNGKRHRIDGPAIEYSDGLKEWHLNGKRHRKNGPAVELSDGTKEWWINGEFIRIQFPPGK